MLKTGKLDSEVLKRIIFDNIKFKRDEIITRPGIGEDCAEIDFGEYICVMSTAVSYTHLNRSGYSTS